MYILNKNAQDFYDLLSFVVKFCPWDFRTFSAETKNQSGCMRMCTKYHWLCHVHTYCMCVCCARRAKNRWSCSSQWLPNGRDNNWHSPDCKLAKKENGKQKDTAAGVKVGTVGYILIPCNLWTTTDMEYYRQKLFCLFVCHIKKGSGWSCTGYRGFDVWYAAPAQ